MSEPGTLERVGRHLVRALEPLRDAVASRDAFRAFMLELGWKPTDVPPAYTQLGNAIDQAISKIDALGDPPTSQQVEDLVTAAKDAYDAIRNIAVAPPGVDAGAFLVEIGERLPEFLLVRYLALEVPRVYAALQMLNVIQTESVPASGGRPSFVRVHLQWDEIPKIVSEPSQIPARVYGWGTPTLNVDRLVGHLASLLADLRVPVHTERPDDDLLDGFVDAVNLFPVANTSASLVVPFYYDRVAGVPLYAALAMHELPAADGKLPGIVIEPRIPETVPLSVPLGGSATLRVTAGTNVASTLGLLVRPDGISIKYPFEPGTTPPSAGIGVGFDFAPDQATILVGAPNDTRLEIKGGSIDLAASSINGEFDASFTAQMKSLSLVIAGGSGDSFIQSMLGDGQTRIDLSLGLELSRKNGVRFTGSGAFEVAAHPHLHIGPVAIDEVDVRLAVPASRPPDLVLEIGANVTGELGPLTVVVQGIGLKLNATFKSGNLGPIDLDPGFKPPTGLGLAIDAGGFKGGGFLSFDSDKGEYAGALELEFQSLITVKAVGILTTKMPDGSAGFSLLIIISAEFPPIQLSFGFTLLGIGGILGLNRTAAYDALRLGIRDGSIESVLFPSNIVANAPKIIGDLKRVFPPLEGRFLVGPMAKLGWGTPTIISIELGLVLEIPRPAFAILGVLRVALPADDVALLNLQVNFLGVIDFGKGQISFDASLYDSHVLTFPLTGDMAVRIYWSDDANFLLTVGGFHPAYVPPPMGLPDLRRLSIDIFPGMPRIHAESYFAVTSNTVQFGAKVELTAGAAAFNVYGFMAYDVLITVSPFHFVAEFSAMLAVRSGSATLFSVRVDATLEGPTPWHAYGTGSFEIGFIITITIHVHFDVTIGDAQTTSLPPIQVMPKLVDALNNAGNWRAVLPDATSQRVSLRELPDSGDALVLHPFGALEIKQKVVPLDLAIARFGAQTPDHGTSFRIAEVKLGTDPEAATAVRDEFAPAQFFALSDADKLARKSFESYDAGVQVGDANSPVADYVVALDVVYEVIYIPLRQARTLFKLAKGFFDALVRGAAVSKSAFAYAPRAPSALATPKVAVVQETYAVALTRDVSLFRDDLVFASEEEAHQAMRTLTAQDPRRVSELQVVPLYEVEGA